MDNESEGVWSGFFDALIDCGLKWCCMAVSDGHKGIQIAVSSINSCQIAFRLRKLHVLQYMMMIMPLTANRR
jgi:transposase-like protein